ncbi:MAG: TatD family hydrolase [Rickettsiales bacterium]|nr:TatD family hydrolase [Rickettsiales bacterium]
MSYDFLVDSHCHLNMLDKNNLKDIIGNAFEQNVKIINNIGTNINEFQDVLEIANTFDNVYCSLGIHPEEIKEIVKINELQKWFGFKKVIGIGESGLDYHYRDDNKTTQKQNFEIHIELARQTNKPLIIHSRDADEDMMDILKSEFKNGEFKFLLHSFTSGKDLLKTGLDLCGYISLSGIVTFKNAEDIRQNIRIVPNERILIETDSPFLAPVPHRGKTNEPSFVKDIAVFLSGYLGINFLDFQKLTTKNFMRLFSLI